MIKYLILVLLTITACKEGKICVYEHSINGEVYTYYIDHQRRYCNGSSSYGYLIQTNHNYDIKSRLFLETDNTEEETAKVINIIRNNTKGPKNNFVIECTAKRVGTK
jgi:hypothetical protein